MKHIGKVVDGRGDCSKWPDNLLAHYQRISQLKLIKGTLNIQLSEPLSILENCSRLLASEWGGRDDVLLRRCSVNRHPGVIIRTAENERNGTHVPKTIVEIASDLNLRVRLRLETGDVVELDISHSQFPE